jgi:DNA-directed RNA polymerase specialized sigma24 family protein
MTNPKEKRSRAGRFAVTTSPDFFLALSEKTNPWYEDPKEVESGLAWGRRKARLLRWVRLHIGRQLTPRERECLELHFFKGISIADIAAQTGSDITSVHRAVRRSVHKLRAAARSARFRGSPRPPLNPPAKREKTR